MQRSFRRLRRGYDPDEVDRHLELVSQWFTSTDVSRAFTHQRTELEERERAVAAREAEQARHVEGARLEADARWKVRAAAPTRRPRRPSGRLLTRAPRRRRFARTPSANGRSLLDEARAEAAAAELRRVAEERAAMMLRDASAEAETMLAEAHAAAARELTAARQEREQRVGDARAEAAQLAERLRAQVEEELRIYGDRRRREADRLAEARLGSTDRRGRNRTRRAVATAAPASPAAPVGGGVPRDVARAAVRIVQDRAMRLAQCASGAVRAATTASRRYGCRPGAARG